MKVALVHSFYAAATPSGENTVVQMQVDELRRSGHDVQLFDVRTDDLADWPLYKLTTAFNVATGGGANPLPSIRKFNPDVVHVHNLFPNFSTSWLQDCPFPVVATIHNFRPVCAAGTLFLAGETCTRCPDRGQHHALINACYKDSRLATLPLAVRNVGGLRRDALLSRADEVLFLSKRSMNTYVQFGLSTASCSVLPNFVPAHIGSSGIESGAWVYAGRLTEEKGILDLLSAWPTDKPLRVLGDGPCLEEARSIANPKVHFAGSVSHERVLKELASSAGLVLPSKWAEGLPTIYLEALATGLPVITRVGNSAADDVGEHGHGIVYSDTSEIPGAVRGIEEAWSLFSARANKRYMGAYTPEAWSQGITRSYERAISRRGAQLETGY